MQLIATYGDLLRRGRQILQMEYCALMGEESGNKKFFTASAYAVLLAIRKSYVLMADEGYTTWEKIFLSHSNLQTIHTSFHLKRSACGSLTSAGSFHSGQEISSGRLHLVWSSFHLQKVSSGLFAEKGFQQVGLDAVFAMAQQVWLPGKYRLDLLAV